MKNSLIVLIIIIAVLGLGGTGYFFEAKSKVETELAILKRTDLAKENASLKLKLKSFEEELSTEKEKNIEANLKMRTLEEAFKKLEARLSKLKLFFGVLSAFHDWEYDSSHSGLHILDRSTSQIDSAISVLNDSPISNLWTTVKANFPRAKETGDFRYGEVLILIHSKISNLIQ